MRIKTGYLYHIKDEYFNKINDKNLMQNHERGKKRPTYFTIKDGKILWFIPVSSKVDKYKKIVNNKIKKYGFCNTILIEKIFGKVFWDYSNQRFHIGHYISLEMTLVWGIASIIFVYIVHPMLDFLIKKIPSWVTIIFIVLFIFDLSKTFIDKKLK